MVALVTQPDKEKGRGRGLTPPPLKPVAERRGVQVLQPRRARDLELREALRALAPELQVVVAYGQILPPEVIHIPPLGTVNVHASLLPRYRGAAPIQWAIVRGETETGVTTMLIDEGLDTGPTLLARALAIGPQETAEQLAPRLAVLGAETLLLTLDGLARGSLRPAPQDHTRASLAPLLRKEDGRLDWVQLAEDVVRRVRGFRPWPGVTCGCRGRSLRVLQAALAPVGPGAPGEIVGLDREGILVTCGQGTRLRLIEVQPESRKPMAASAFAAGARLTTGFRFD